MTLRRCVLASLALSAVAAHAQSLGAAGAFNAVVFGNFTPTSWTDSQGRLAVGGNYNTGNVSYTINGSNIAGGYGLIAGGSVTSFSNTVYGGLFSNGNLTWNDPSIKGNVASNGSVNFNGSGGSINGTISMVTGQSYQAPSYFPKPTYSSTPTADPFNFNSAQTYYDNLSSSLGKMATTGTVTDSYNNIVLSGNSAGLNVFNVSAAQLASSTNLSLNITKPGATAVINIYGSPTVNFVNHAYSLNGISGSNVVYNFVGATKVVWNGAGVNGSMLMPEASLVDPSSGVAYGNINGTLVADSYATGLQLNEQAFTGNLPAPAVPEPAPFVALGTGAFLVLLRRRRRG